ncbi:hypothetical protein ACWGB8_21130 [Kitasatospora sp. NPDC054939]
MTARDPAARPSARAALLARCRAIATVAAVMAGTPLTRSTLAELSRTADPDAPARPPTRADDRR